jgi:hypothetical protein
MERTTYVTLNTEYEFTNGRCTKVTSRRTGHTDTTSTLLGRMLACFVRVTSNGGVKPVVDVTPGVHLVFERWKGEDRDTVTSPLTEVRT